MFLADYHTHSRFSPDGRDGFAALLAAAKAAGLAELCVTDHCDISAGGSQEFPARERYKAFEEARGQNGTGVRLLLGIELGEAIFDLESARAAAAACPYDYIIGSHHVLRGERDFYYFQYLSEEQCHQLLARYLAELAETAEWGGFDVLGHIDYPLRYMRRDGFAVSLLPRYEPELRALYGLLAQKGLGIEINFGKWAEPDPALFALFRQCGGEVVTVGSDAHRAGDVGRGIAQGAAICREAGFAHIAAFEQRRVRYEKI